LRKHINAAEKQKAEQEQKCSAERISSEEENDQAMDVDEPSQRRKCKICKGEFETYSGKSLCVDCRELPSTGTEGCSDEDEDKDAEAEAGEGPITMTLDEYEATAKMERDDGDDATVAKADRRKSTRRASGRLSTHAPKVDQVLDVELLPLDTEGCSDEDEDKDAEAEAGEGPITMTLDEYEATAKMERDDGDDATFAKADRRKSTRRASGRLSTHAPIALDRDIQPEPEPEMEPGTAPNTNCSNISVGTKMICVKASQARGKNTLHASLLESVSTVFLQ
jgi:hypothetical protein